MNLHVILIITAALLWMTTWQVHMLLSFRRRPGLRTVFSNIGYTSLVATAFMAVPVYLTLPWDALGSIRLSLFCLAPICFLVYEVMATEVAGCESGRQAAEEFLKRAKEASAEMSEE